MTDPLVFGTICGLVSAVVYTCANAFLRAVSDCDPVWVSAIKAIPTVFAMAPVMGLMSSRGQRIFPSAGMLAAIAAGGLVGQVGGNVSFQWALGEIGVALAVPLCLGGMILTSAVFGRIFLGEPVTPWAAFALALLMVAIFILSLGADEARESVTRVSATPWRQALGVGAGCLSGMCYATLNVILRRSILGGAPLPTTLGTVSVMGVLSLTLIAWLRIGTPGMLATTPADFLLMLGAGICNTVAFVALTKSLQLTNVVYVNALNATQATLAALAGVLIFQEALSPWLATGVGLTIAGLLVLMRAHRAMAQPQME